MLLSITARTPGCLLAIQYDLKEAIGNTHCFMANHSQTLPSQPGLCGDLTVTGICVGGSGERGMFCRQHQGFWFSIIHPEVFSVQQGSLED